MKTAQPLQKILLASTILVGMQFASNHNYDHTMLDAACVTVGTTTTCSGTTTNVGTFTVPAIVDTVNLDPAAIVQSTGSAHTFFKNNGAVPITFNLGNGALIEELGPTNRDAIRVFGNDENITLNLAEDSIIRGSRGVHFRVDEGDGDLETVSIQTTGPNTLIDAQTFGGQRPIQVRAGVVDLDFTDATLLAGSSDIINIRSADLQAAGQTAAITLTNTSAQGNGTGIVFNTVQADPNRPLIDLDIINSTVDAALTGISIIRAGGNININNGNILAGNGLSLNADGGALTSDPHTITITNNSIFSGVLNQGNQPSTILIDNSQLGTAPTTRNHNTGNGVDSVTVQNGSIITRSFSLGAGDDQLTANASTFNNNINGNDGNDQIIIDNNSNIVGAITTGNQDDVVRVLNNSVTSSISTNNQNDIIEVLTGAQTGNINTGNNDDSVTVDNATTGFISAGNGTNTINIRNNSVTGNIITSFGVDQIFVDNQSTIGTISASSGVDTVRITNTSVTSDIALGNGNDIIDVLTNSQTGTITAGNDDDTVTVDNAISSNISGGNGLDQIMVINNATSGNISGDGDNDRIIVDCSSTAGIVRGNNQDDIIIFGGTATSIAGDNDNDTIILQTNCTSVGGGVLTGGGLNGNGGTDKLTFSLDESLTLVQIDIGGTFGATPANFENFCIEREDITAGAPTITKMTLTGTALTETYDMTVQNTTEICLDNVSIPNTAIINETAGISTTMIVNANSTIAGTLNLGDEDDDICVIAGASFAATSILDGGAGTDDLAIDITAGGAGTSFSGNSSSIFAAGAAVNNFESLALKADNLTNDKQRANDLGDELTVDAGSFLTSLSDLSFSSFGGITIAVNAAININGSSDDNRVAITAGAALTGDLNLDAGQDKFFIDAGSGASITPNTAIAGLDGGANLVANPDILEIAGTGGTSFTISEAFTDWECLSIDDANVTFSATYDDATHGDILNVDLFNNAILTVPTGATVTTTITGDTTNNDVVVGGTLDITQNAADAIILNAGDDEVCVQNGGTLSILAPTSLGDENIQLGSGDDILKIDTTNPATTLNVGGTNIFAFSTGTDPVVHGGADNDQFNITVSATTMIPLDVTEAFEQSNITGSGTETITITSSKSSDNANNDEHDIEVVNSNAIAVINIGAASTESFGEMVINGDATDTSYLINAAIITGRNGDGIGFINAGAGDDSVTVDLDVTTSLSDPDFAVFNGGAETSQDTLTFNATSDRSFDGGDHVDFEIMDLTGDQTYTLTGVHTIDDLLLDNATNMTIPAGATVNANNSITADIGDNVITLSGNLNTAIINMDAGDDRFVLDGASANLINPAMTLDGGTGTDKIEVNNGATLLLTPANITNIDDLCVANSVIGAQYVDGSLFTGTVDFNNATIGDGSNNIVIDTDPTAATGTNGSVINNITANSLCFTGGAIIHIQDLNDPNLGTNPPAPDTVFCIADAAPGNLKINGNITIVDTAPISITGNDIFLVLDSTNLPAHLEYQPLLDTSNGDLKILVKALTFGSVDGLFANLINSQDIVNSALIGGVGHLFNPGSLTGQMHARWDHADIQNLYHENDPSNANSSNNTQDHERDICSTKYALSNSGSILWGNNSDMIHYLPSVPVLSMDLADINAMEQKLAIMLTGTQNNVRTNDEQEVIHAASVNMGLDYGSRLHIGEKNSLIFDVAAMGSFNRYQFEDLDDNATDAFNVYNLNSKISMQYRALFGGLALMPTASIHYNATRHENHTQGGGNPAPKTFTKQYHHSVDTQIGLNASYATKLDMLDTLIDAMRMNMNLSYAKRLEGDDFTLAAHDAAGDQSKTETMPDYVTIGASLTLYGHIKSPCKNQIDLTAFGSITIPISADQGDAYDQQTNTMGIRLGGYF